MGDSWSNDIPTPRGTSPDIRPSLEQCRSWDEVAGLEFVREESLCCSRGSYDHVVRQLRDLDCGGHAVHLEFEFRRVDCPRCGVKRERLDWLAANPRYTRRFLLAVGSRCRTATVKDVALEMNLHWETVKDIDKLDMQEQLDLAGPPNPTAIGIDEIAIGPGHTYLIIVSDLQRKRAIWFGGTDRKEASMDLFYASIPLEN